MRYRAINFSATAAASNWTPQVKFNPFYRIDNTNTFKELNSREPATLTKMNEVSGVFLCFYNSYDGKDRTDDYMVVPETHPLFNYYAIYYSTDRYSLRSKLRLFLATQATKLAELFT